MLTYHRKGPEYVLFSTASDPWKPLNLFSINEPMQCTIFTFGTWKINFQHKFCLIITVSEVKMYSDFSINLAKPSPNPLLPQTTGKPTHTTGS